MNDENNIPKNKAIDIKEVAKMYKEQYNEELPNIVDRFGYIHKVPAATKPQNEVRKLNDMVNEARYLTNSKKPSTNLDIPKDTLTSKSQAVRKYFDEFNERGKRIVKWFKPKSLLDLDNY